MGPSVDCEEKMFSEFSTLAKLYQTFYIRKIQMYGVFDPGKPFQPSLMFVSLPWSGAPERYFTRVV